LEFAKEFNIKPVVTCDTHYILKEDKETHEVLLAVQSDADINDQDRKLSMSKFDLSLIEPKELIEAYKDTPEVIENTQEIVDRCNFDFVKNKLFFPKFVAPDNKTSEDYLNELA